MNTVSWEPSILEDLLDEASVWEPSDNSPNEASIFRFLADLLTGICYTIHRLTIIAIQLILLILHPGWMHFLGLILAFLVYNFSFSVAVLYQNFTLIRDLLHYLHYDLVDRLQIEGLEEYPIESYVSTEQIKSIKASRVGAWVKENKYPIARVFVIKQSPGKIAAERKGFALPAGYRVADPSNPYRVRPYPLSLIFLADKPGDETISSKFYIYHEIGHTIKRGWRVRTRPYLTLSTISLLWLWVGFNTNNFLWSISFLIPYCLIRLFLEAVPQRNELDDELIADTFAIRNIPKDIPLKTLQKRIGRAFQQVQNIPYKQIINQLRTDNLNILITKREQGKSFSNFEISRKIAPISVEILGILFILAIIPLHPPSLGFLIGILLLNLALGIAIGVMTWRIVGASAFLEKVLEELISEG